MPAIDKLMKRLGFVKLSEFGLVLTPEGRVISMRPAVLDDGFGGKIVGWQDGDLAAAELEKWEPARPAAQQAAATRVAAPPRPQARPTAPMPVVAQPARATAAMPVVAQPARPTAPHPVVAPPIPVRATQPVAVVAAPAPLRVVPPAPVAAPVVVAAPIVAPAPVVEEDDWEWTIAIARARSAADDVQAAVATARSSQRRMRADTVPPPVIAAKDPIAQDEWPKTQPLTDIDYNDYSSPAAEVVRVARTTVIPIPQMPLIGKARIEPVVRPPIVATNPPPRRLAKGTGPQHPNTVSRSAHTDDTVPGFVLVEPANEDTVPSISIAPPKPALPSIKRVMRG